MICKAATGEETDDEDDVEVNLDRLEGDEEVVLPLAGCCGGNKDVAYEEATPILDTNSFVEIISILL